MKRHANVVRTLVGIALFNIVVIAAIGAIPTEPKSVPQAVFAAPVREPIQVTDKIEGDAYWNTKTATWTSVKVD
jgi:hypothetical protein